MNKFNTCLEILLRSYAENHNSDEEFVPLYDCYRSNSRLGYQSYDVFDLQNMNSADCKAKFRVEKADLPRLADALQITAVFSHRQKSICDGLEGLCVLLRRTSQSTSGTSFLCSKHIPGFNNISLRKSASCSSFHSIGLE